MRERYLTHDPKFTQNILDSLSAYFGSKWSEGKDYIVKKKDKDNHEVVETKKSNRFCSNDSANV